jgi:hypothetical protein
MTGRTSILRVARSWVLSGFGTDPERAQAAYVRFVEAALPQAVGGGPSENPIVRGTDEYSARVVQQVSEPSREVPRRQRTGHSLSHYEETTATRDEAIRLAWATGCYSQAAIARHFGLHYSTVSKICRRPATLGPADPGPADPEGPTAKRGG